MNKLAKQIKLFNLVFTNTKKARELERDYFDLSRTRVDYKNTISLSELIDILTVVHRSFLKEYNELEKIDFGEKVEVLDYTTYEENNYRYRAFLLNVEKPKFIDKQKTTLCLVDSSDTGEILATAIECGDEETY